jgi:hypothetical protein
MLTVVTPSTAPDRRASRSGATDEAAIDRWTNEGGASAVGDAFGLSVADYCLARFPGELWTPTTS